MPKSICHQILIPIVSYNASTYIRVHTSGYPSLMPNHSQDITKEKTKKKQAIVPTEPLAKYIQAKYKHHGAYTRELEQ